MRPRAQLAACGAFTAAAIVTVLAIGPGHWLAATAAAAAVPAAGGCLTAWRRVFLLSGGDLAPWESARSLADLGELTARWLEGTIPAEPGYDGGPDEETLPLVPVLATLNRAGFVTTGSQPGGTGICDGTPWQQRAAVEAFAGAGPALAVTVAARAAGLIVVACEPGRAPRWRIRLGGRVEVTRSGGRVCTWSGAVLSRRHIRGAWGACHPDAAAVVRGAWQVTVIDPEWGRPDLLWRVLFGAVASQPGSWPPVPPACELRGGDRP